MGRREEGDEEKKKEKGKKKRKKKRRRRNCGSAVRDLLLVMSRNCGFSPYLFRHEFRFVCHTLPLKEYFGCLKAHYRGS